MRRATLTAALLALSGTWLELTAQAAESIPTAQFERWMAELSNWGRWGDDDQLGTLNLMTPEKRAAAAALVQSGVTVALAREVEKFASRDNPEPMRHEVRWGGGWGVDTYTIDYHGFAYSHLDALAHTSFDGRFYNGHPTSTVDESGATHLGVETMHIGFFTRGILIDIPRLKNVTYLEPASTITIEDLDRWERETGIAIESGDVVLVRTGRWARRAETGAWDAGEHLAGLHATTAAWFKVRNVAAVGTDAAADVLPAYIDGHPFPLHELLLVAMGTPIFDNLDLESLANAAARQDRWEFLFTVAPMRIPGGFGAPVNPLAVF
jgi:kynurenine formamidase